MLKYFLVCLSALFAVTLTADPLAQAKCRALHSTDADPSSGFSNYNCFLMCSIHGKAWPHNMNEGLPCPGMRDSRYTCRNGQCVAAMPPVQLGWIDIEMASAQLSKKAMAYATVCLQNSSNAVPIPIVNRQSCVTCQTKVVSPSTGPVWDAVCSASGTNLWVADSRVTFEVWEQAGSKINFAGGSTVLVSQVVQKGDSHKQINLPLVNGNNQGNIRVRVTWTAWKNP